MFKACLGARPPFGWAVLVIWILPDMELPETLRLLNERIPLTWAQLFPPPENYAPYLFEYRHFLTSEVYMLLLVSVVNP
jgi:hypothetical protein